MRAKAFPGRPGQGAGGGGAGPWVVAALALYGVLGSPLFRIDSVEVQPPAAEPSPLPAALREEIRARLSGAFGKHLLGLDVEPLRQAVGTLAVVADVRVRRMLPSTLAVEVRARQAVAHLPYGPGFLEVDGEGRVLGPARSAPGSLPVLSGVLAPQEAVTVGQLGPLPLVEAAMAAQAAAPVLGTSLSQLHVDAESGQLVLFLTDGSRIVWGEVGEAGLEQGFHRERARLLAALKPRLSSLQPFVLDMSDPRRVVWLRQPTP